MSNSDLWVRDVIASYGLLCLIAVAMIIWIYEKWSDLQRSVYRSYLKGFEVECAELTAPYRAHLFGQLRNVVSNDRVLRSTDCIRLLEIGVKTGVLSQNILNLRAACAFH